MANEGTQTAPQITIPTVINLGGQDYSVADTPALKSLVEAVRKSTSQTEKTKLYSTIETLQNQLKQLNNVTVVEEQTAERKEQLKNEILNAATEKFEELIKPLREQTGFVQAAQVAEYRNRLIIENQGKCIPELVVGNSIAELDAALVASKSVFEKYGLSAHAAFAGTQITPTQTQQQNVATPIVQPQAQTVLPTIPATTAPVQSNDINIGKMTMKEFASKRDELQAQLEELLAVGG